ncbi:MAG: recombination mediator RecR [Pseudomonadales bacterium]|jgi:recombination protein RecR
MSFSPLVDQLIDALRCLPGIGPKSAQRMALHLLERDREGAFRLAQKLAESVRDVKHCQQCRILCETDLCRICADPKRDDSKLCVVESPSDVLAIEQTNLYRGHYFVLMGHLSPIDGIGPQDIGIDLLVGQVRDKQVEELIMATNPTVEGEATAHYIAGQLEALDRRVNVTRIAHGVPLGGELEFVDGGTLAHALQGRQSIF